MRKFITIILVLIGFAAYAQPSNSSSYLYQNAKWRFKYPIWADSGIYVKSIVKNANQNRVCIIDSVTGKVGFKYITGGTTDTTSLSNRINLRVKYTDTSAMLAPYFLASDSIQWRNRLRYSDTAGMLLKYLRAADTLKLSNRINLKQDIITAGNGLIKGGSTLYVDTLKQTSQYGNSWQNGMFIGSTNNRSVRFHSNNLLRGQLDSNGRWAFGTMKPIAPIHIGVAGTGRQKFMFVGEPGFLSTYGFNFYTDANTGGFYIHGFNNSVEASSPAFTIERNGNRVGFNTGSGNAIASSAIVEIVSTTGGFLPPRMTTTQRTSISSPAEGLEVYDLTLHKKYVWDGSAWQACW